MSKHEIFKRYVLFIISLFFAAMGVAFTKHAELGVSPISAVANVLSCKLTFFSLGTWLIIWNCVMIIGQIILLGKKFQLIQLLQVPLSFLFGWFTDLGMEIVSQISINLYIERISLVIAGIIILAFGISLSVTANVIMNSGEAFVKAVSDTIKKKFGNVKIFFDVCCVIIALILSIAFFHFKIVGIREGTIISALFTGVVVKFFTGRIKQPLDSILSDKKIDGVSDN